jgi:hypothetical protein
MCAPRACAWSAPGCRYSVSSCVMACSPSGCGVQAPGADILSVRRRRRGSLLLRAAHVAVRVRREGVRSERVACAQR